MKFPLLCSRTNCGALCTRAICTLAIFAQVIAAQVPIEQEPRHHIDFTDASLRIVQPRIPPGDTTLEHLHTSDEVTICIHGSTMRAKRPGEDWSKPGSPCVPGTAGAAEYTGHPRSHAVQNAGSEAFHLVLVENLRTDGWKEYKALAVEGLKLVKENRSFRIYEVQSPASGTVHTHEVPTVAVLVSGDAVAGEKRLNQPGDWAYVPAGGEHRVAGSAQARVIEVEVR